MKKSDRLQQKEQQLTTPQVIPSQILEVKWSERWEIFRRLKTLGINCKCSTNQPLLVDLHSPTTAILIWSVIRQYSTSRSTLISWLNNCWEAENKI